MHYPLRFNCYKYCNYVKVIAMRNCVVQCQGPLAEIKKNDPELYESWRKALKESKSETK